MDSKVKRRLLVSLVLIGIAVFLILIMFYRNTDLNADEADINPALVSTPVKSSLEPDVKQRAKALAKTQHELSLQFSTVTSSQ